MMACVHVFILDKHIYSVSFYGKIIMTVESSIAYTCTKLKKVQVGKDQEKAQSEKDSHSHSKDRDGKKTN